MNVVAIIQARCGSTRFPNKVFADICGKPLIWHVINRLKFAKTINRIVLATTTNPHDNKLFEWAIQNSIDVFRGSENDVLNRYYSAAKLYKADVIVRITADDPFKEPIIIDKAVSTLLNEEADFVCNNFPPTFPEGLDVEVFTFKTLEIGEKSSRDSFEREHVTQYLYRNSSLFKIVNVLNDENLSYLRWTIDTEKDFLMAKKVYSLLYNGDNQIFHMNDILALIDLQPEISTMNVDVVRSDMYKTI